MREFKKTLSSHLPVDNYFTNSPGPRLMTDTQHSTLKTQCIWMGESRVWSVNPECRVLSIHHKFWAQALNLWRFLSILHLKLQQIHMFEWGILKCGRIHILCSGIFNQIHGVLSVECWVSVISLGPGYLQRQISLPLYDLLVCQWGTNNIQLPDRWRHLGSGG